jgi:hypothetical protein
MRSSIGKPAWVVMGVLAMAVIGVAAGSSGSKTKAVQGPVTTQTATATLAVPVRPYLVGEVSQRGSQCRRRAEPGRKYRWF